MIVVSPTVTGCDGQCDWKIQKGTTVYESGSNYTSGNVSFYDQGGTGHKDYKLNISRDVNGVKQTKKEGSCLNGHRTMQRGLPTIHMEATRK